MNTIQLLAETTQNIHNTYQNAILFRVLLVDIMNKVNK